MPAKSPLLVNVVDLRQGPLEMIVDEEAGALDLDVDDTRFTGRVTGRLTWKWVDERVVATGRLRASAVAPCVRCLEDVPLELEVEARLVYSDEPAPEGEVVDVGMDEEGIIHFHGDVIDPREDLRAVLLTELDDRPLCKLDCKGLCPVCGADLNKTGPHTHDEPSPEGEDASGGSSWKNQIEQMRDKL